MNFCPGCKKFPHPGTPCLDDDTIAFISQSDQIYRFCPNLACRYLLIKDEHCNIVTCIQCKTEFEFCCSSLYKPIYFHENSYHRSDCADYAPYFVNGALPNERSAKCPECAKI